MATQSRFDVSGQAFQRGAKAEDKFYTVLTTRFPGKKVIPASPAEEKLQHWDYKLCLDVMCSKSTKYEVKGVRKLEMRDAQVQDKLFPVEFLSVDGHPGWARGHADYIAFETLSDWILVRPADLLNMAIGKIKENAAKRGITVNNLDDILNNQQLRVFRSKDALYKVYGRAGRGDALTWVTKEDILGLPHEIWREGEVGTVSEPIVRVTPKRGNMGPGGKQLWSTDVSVWQGNKLLSSNTLQGKWDQSKVDQTLKSAVPEAKWNADEIARQLRTNPVFTGLSPAGFKDWVSHYEGGR